MIGSSQFPTWLGHLKPRVFHCCTRPRNRRSVTSMDAFCALELYELCLWLASPGFCLVWRMTNGENPSFLPYGSIHKLEGYCSIFRPILVWNLNIDHQSILVSLHNGYKEKPPQGSPERVTRNWFLIQPHMHDVYVLVNDIIRHIYIYIDIDIYIYILICV